MYKDDDEQKALAMIKKTTDQERVGELTTIAIEEFKKEYDEEIQDTTPPQFIEHSLDGQAGQELTFARDGSAYQLKVIGQENESGNIIFQYKINNGQTQTTTEQVGDNNRATLETVVQGYTTNGDFEGVKSEVTLSDGSNQAQNDKFFPLSFTERKARDYMLEVLNTVGASGVGENATININDIWYDGIDVGAAFDRGDPCKNFVVSIEYESHEDFINKSDLPENKISRTRINSLSNRL
jgi:hypothetical protein